MVLSVAQASWAFRRLLFYTEMQMAKQAEPWCTDRLQVSWQLEAVAKAIWEPGQSLLPPSELQSLTDLQLGFLDV
jgi:predicted 3-demethylubiquinone-9 3-methyltransferase (glyoxalase superfamily)